MRKVIITAGHNGPHTGAGGFIDEGGETIWLRNRVVEYLDKYGIKAEKDQDKMSLTGVVAWIKKLVGKTDIVVDLHFNAFNKKARGVEAVVSAEGAIENSMAEDMCNAIAKLIDIPNRGVKGEAAGHHSKLAMLSKFEAEQMILEICFCDNKEDSEAYNKRRWEVARCIAQVIARYAK